MLDELPEDYANPQWDAVTRVHEWKNYISDLLRELWPTFTDEQKAAIATNANDMASREEWD